LPQKAQNMRTAPGERVRLDERRHGIVLVGSFLRAFAIAGPGLFALVLGWPATVVGAALLALAALVAVRAVWNWERTRLVLTTENLCVVKGTLRRHSAAVRLTRVGKVEIEQSLLGRLLDYGTIVAGDLELAHVPNPRRLLERIAEDPETRARPPHADRAGDPLREFHVRDLVNREAMD
jgi:membrane protein YdbS with pleckstrin-like domain